MPAVDQRIINSLTIQCRFSGISLFYAGFIADTSLLFLNFMAPVLSSIAISKFSMKIPLIVLFNRPDLFPDALASFGKCL